MRILRQYNLLKTGSKTYPTLRRATGGHTIEGLRVMAQPLRFNCRSRPSALSSLCKPCSSGIFPLLFACRQLRKIPHVL